MPVKKTKTAKKTVAVKNHGRLTMIPLRSWIMFWFFVIATMTLVIVCFTNAFLNIDDESNQKTAAAFQVIRQNLEAQVAELQGRAEVAQRAEGRILTTGRVRECDLAWATSTPDVYVSYIEPITKVRMSLPYSFQWGNDAYAVTPFNTEHESGVSFGPVIGPGKDCYTSRDSWLTVSSNTTSTNQLRALARDEFHATNIRERTVNGIPVLSYDVAWEDMHFNQWIGFGRNYQYRIQSDGWLTDAEAIKIIQSLKVVK